MEPLGLEPPFQVESLISSSMAPSDKKGPLVSADLSAESEPGILVSEEKLGAWALMVAQNPLAPMASPAKADFVSCYPYTLFYRRASIYRSSVIHIEANGVPRRWRG